MSSIANSASHVLNATELSTRTPSQAAAARRAECPNGIRQIGLALLLCENRDRHVPAVEVARRDDTNLDDRLRELLACGW